MEISISKEQLAALPTAHFGGQIKVVDKIEEVSVAVAQLRKSDIIGFDTETRPAFKKGQTFQVALLQLSAEDRCYLFRLNKIGLPECLKELLEDGSKIKIGLSTHDDFRNLHRAHDFNPDGFVELQQYAAKWGIKDKSLSKLHAILFGQRISKSQRLSNWEADELSEAQQHYAALDAYACIQIFKQLHDGLFRPEESRYIIK